MTRRRFNQILFLLGLSLLVYLLRRVGWDALAHDFRLMGWALVLILVLSGIKYAISAFAWAAAFFPEERQSWRTLFGSRLAGESMNYLSIAGPLLSEPIKASMLHGVRFASALASTLLETTMNAIAAGLVTVAGLAMLVLYAQAFALRSIGYVFILILLALAGSFLYALKYRVPFLTWPWKRLRHISWFSSPKLGEHLAVIQERMHRLRAERPGALWLIFLLSLVSQGLGLLEIYAVVIPLGIRPGFSNVLMMEAFTKLVKALFFFVPARIGADEGSSAGIFALLGLSPATGVTLALARRARTLVWSAVGLAFLLAHSVKAVPQRSEVEAWSSSAGPGFALQARGGAAARTGRV
ncbi:MAG: flippase-like domain-containing protein [Acidobacteria bacterium]|nr:flippase-like domain-containing protein [Acidobacteriota bacterium]